MRQIHNLLHLPLIVALGADALDASIFTFNSYREPSIQKDPTVADTAVRRLVELRVAPPDVPNLGTVDEETVKLLNHFGGAQSPLFGSSPEHKGQKTTIILEGIAPEIGSSVQAEYPDTCVVSHASSGLLVADFLDTFLGSERDERYCALNADEEAAERSGTSQVNPHCSLKNQVLQDNSEVFNELMGHANIAESWVDTARSETILRISLKPTKTPLDDRVIAGSLGSLFRRLSAAPSEGKQVTAVLLTRYPVSAKSHSNLPARDTVNHEITGSRFDQRELLSSSSLVPTCHASESLCLETTNNCSGHGFCYNKSKSGSQASASDCYACKCQDTIIKNQDGSVQRVQWAGPACQKRDISSPFFLIASVSIIGTLAISAAIGLLFKVGQDELPGVIGAGVGSAGAQK